MHGRRTSKVPQSSTQGRLLLTGRDPVKAANAVASVKSLTGNSHVHGFTGDFSDFADIRRFAADVSKVLQPVRALP